MKKRFIAPLVVIALVIVFLWLWYKEGLLPVNSSVKTPQIFVIEKGQSINTIINNLQKDGLIRNRVVFYVVVRVMGIERAIQAGDYRLYRSMNAQEIAQNLTHGTLDKWVTVVEGLRKEEIAQVLTKSHGIEPLVFIRDAHEGKLFPDTYLIPTAITAKQIIVLMERNFSKKVTSDILATAQTKKLDENDLLTAASLVEREAKKFDDREIVAGILFNRLNADMPLQVDATVQYALGFDEATSTWWKKDLTLEDLKVVSPYNTYTNPGLPPGPICNPGLDSIKAVVNARKTDYLYYLTDKKGNMHYSKTLEEHNKNVAKYL